MSDYPARALINLAAIQRNVGALRERAGAPVMAVVKADAYGHGLVPSARAALAVRPGSAWRSCPRRSTCAPLGWTRLS